MTLLDEARALVRRPGITCALDTIRRANPVLAAEIDDAIASDVPAPAISEALRARGIELDRQVLNRHRRGDCIRCR